MKYITTTMTSIIIITSSQVHIMQKLFQTYIKNKQSVHMGECSYFQTHKSLSLLSASYNT